MCNSFQKVVKLQTEFKIKSVLLVNKFACASWYSMNCQNDEFKTVITLPDIKCLCNSQSMVHKESQQVPGIKIKSYTLGYSKHIDILGENHV